MARKVTSLSTEATEVKWDPREHDRKSAEHKRRGHSGNLSYPIFPAMLRQSAPCLTASHLYPPRIHVQLQVPPPKTVQCAKSRQETRRDSLPPAPSGLAIPAPDPLMCLLDTPRSREIAYCFCGTLSYCVGDTTVWPVFCSG